MNVKAEKKVALFVLAGAILGVGYGANNTVRSANGESNLTPWQTMKVAGAHAIGTMTTGRQKTEKVPVVHTQSSTSTASANAKSTLWHRKAVGRYMNQNYKVRGIRKISYNPKTNRLNVQYTHKPNRQQKNYGKYLQKTASKYTSVK